MDSGAQLGEKVEENVNRDYYFNFLPYMVFAIF